MPIKNSAMKLHNIQDNFADHVGQDETSMDDSFRSLFKTGSITLENRMSVYRNNVIKSLRDAIIATYPMTGKMLGADYMKKLARLYALDHKPSQADLNLYGENFADFIADFKPLSKYPYLPDLAKLEWAMNECYFAADDTALDPAALAQQSPETQASLILVLRNAVRLCHAPYRIDQIQSLCAGDSAVTALENGSCTILVYRPDLDVMTMPLQPYEYDFLKSFQQPRNLSEALEDFTAQHNGIDILPMLEKFFSCGIFKIHQ